MGYPRILTVLMIATCLATFLPGNISATDRIKNGNPNGAGLPEWPAYRSDTNYQRMRLDVKSQAEPEPHRDRYLALDAAAAKP